MNLRATMPPNVCKNKKQIAMMEDIQQPYRQFMRSRNYTTNQMGYGPNGEETP